MSSTPPTIASAADRQQSAERSTIVSAGVNCVLSVCQIVAGMWSHSQGLVADGLHTLSDLIADGIVFIANRNSHKGPDEDHQYGHARYENAASLGLGLLLLAAGGGMIWTAVESLRSPHGPEAVHGLALWVALLALASKEGLFRYMLAVAKRIGSRMLIANAWHARSDAISSLVAAIGVAGIIQVIVMSSILPLKPEKPKDAPSEKAQVSSIEALALQGNPQQQPRPQK